MADSVYAIAYKVTIISFHNIQLEWHCVA